MSSSIDGARILVDDSLANAGTTINNFAQAITGELASLISQLQPLTETWTGPAASYFDPLMQEWNAAANGLFGSAADEGLLGEIANAMGVAWDNYSNGEWANVSTWKPSS